MVELERQVMNTLNLQHLAESLRISLCAVIP